MRRRDQLIGVAALAAATYYGVLRIAEAKCDKAVGSTGIAIDQSQPDELAAFERLRGQLVAMDQVPLADRLEELRRKHVVWAAPGLGPERWAAYVDSLGLVKRIYIRRAALLNPRTHLFPRGAPNVPIEYQNAFAWLSLGGAMRHELAHHDGAIEESSAYAQERAWYEEVRKALVRRGIEGEARAAWDWALESAIKSAEKAAQQAAAAS